MSWGAGLIHLLYGPEVGAAAPDRRIPGSSPADRSTSALLARFPQNEVSAGLEPGIRTRDSAIRCSHFDLCAMNRSVARELLVRDIDCVLNYISTELSATCIFSLWPLVTNHPPV